MNFYCLGKEVEWESAGKELTWKEIVLWEGFGCDKTRDEDEF